MKVKKYDNVEVGKVYSSNDYGDFIIVKKESYSKVLIKFIETEFEKYYRTNEILYGSVKDPYRPNVCGVGYIGEGIYKSSYNRVHSKEYALWANIIRRCYDINSDYYHLYGGNGVILDKRWHNFQNFCEDIKDLENYKEWDNKENRFDWTIDKDKYSKEVKIYSKDTCWFTSMEQQILLQNKKRIFGYVDGLKIYDFKNIKDIARELNISQSSISLCCDNKRKSAGIHNNKPIVWRFEDSVYDVVYNSNYPVRKNKINFYNGYVNGVLVFKNVTSKEIINLKLTKYVSGVITSIKNNHNCGYYCGNPIKWEYAEV